MNASKIANIPDPFSIGPYRKAVIHVGLNDVQVHNPKSVQFLSNKNQFFLVHVFNINDRIHLGINGIKRFQEKKHKFKKKTKLILHFIIFVKLYNI